MKNTLKLMILLMLTGSLASCSSSPTLKEFKSVPGGFEVMAPAGLQESTQAIETQAGKIDLHLFSTQENDTGYFISYCDYDPEIVKPEKREKMLDGARDGAVSNVHGKLLSESAITLADNPGRELLMEARPMDGPISTIKTRLFLVKNRLYQVTVAAPRSRADQQEMDHFLQSFKLLAQ